MKIAFIVSGILRIHYLHTHYAMHNFGNYAASCKLISYFDAFLLKCKLLYRNTQAISENNKISWFML